MSSYAKVVSFSRLSFSVGIRSGNNGSGRLVMENMKKQIPKLGY